MVLRDPEAVGSRKLGNCGGTIRMDILRTSKGGFEKPFIAKSTRASELRKALLMQKKESLLADPPWSGIHLARTLNVSRYSFMNSRPASSCSSMDGSYGVMR